MKMKSRSTSLLAALVGLVVVVPLVAEAQAGRPQVQEGNRLYEEGRFEEAHQKYLEALAASPESPVIRFNDGNALYQGTDYQRAMEAYQGAIETGDPALASAAWYNLGNALYRAQELEQSLEAYKQALRMNPSDPDSKHNLERVLEQMQEQEQQEQQDGEDGEEGDEQQDQENQQEEQDQQDQDQEEGDQEDQQPQDQDQPEGEAEPQPRPGEMTAEEAERLLEAIEEDPDAVDRQRASTRGRKPRKPW